MSEYIKEHAKKYDIIVIGAGHAGCEAALASARMGFKTLVLTVNLDHVAFMPCNPSLGGPGKAHIVREIDALGGEMALNMDQTMTQIRMLNTSKGPAVQGLRGQADKARYHSRMKQVLERQENLDLKQEIVENIEVDSRGRASGVVGSTGLFYRGEKIILTTGTFLKARVIIGEATYNAGPNQQYPANELSRSLQDLGFELLRFKTGTPPRISGNSIDFSSLKKQTGEKGLSFSFLSEPLSGKQDDCWIVRTDERTHEIIRENKDRTPLFSGEIEGTGPRYCPSIEDKVMKFPDKKSHQLFLEPEGRSTDEYYLSGFSTSLPLDVQIKMLRTLPGMSEAEIARPAYAIEYDCVASGQFDLSLESRQVPDLFTAGQINGTSGYEEAAGQGIIAGINAGQKLRGKEPMILKRSQTYIGVLIDDLVTDEPKEPYRMMTSRAEYRLLLRQDNADQRLTPSGREIGLVSDKRWQYFQEKQEKLQQGRDYLQKERVTPTAEVREFLQERESGGLSQPASLEKILRRPEISWQDLAALADDLPSLPQPVQKQLEIEAKYKGYIDRQKQQIKEFERQENIRLPEDLEYKNFDNLRREAREKLNRIKPRSLGQASRIAGVSPADIQALLVYLKKEGDL
ncbi:tRNA uridine-5-carboxymethylaminomethyl(34) synthesis enzyme MnmG [Halarsenatibacter silvermanii]|uniref:tRNA uridine 5-carboxymethylaminomethyl modification enzyme MnmG n=1 Tax=Halarsenatibacter silvermanii TaxID=321763 RepID=A0A1G9R567_9FIRM|nr:tRNA uridine-5-carboxymethylaminomethyl(34) synthesis enzyme MnmG [Halarsenatibacter silvermanii]SDM17977.1 tRNA uridine 5-carboxymethylaminomethyl modification enzyme [Halarsenatibacter silvermanii]